MLLYERRANPPPQPSPLLGPLSQRIQQRESIDVIRRENIQVIFAEDVFDEAVPVEEDARCWILFILHDGAENLEDGRYA